MTKPSENLNCIKAINDVSSALNGSLRGKAEQEKKELEMFLFDETVDFVRILAKKLDRYYESKQS